ncbi:phospholipase A and acyltransferase 4-like [Trematomus bernacchii]|uniref:phospholipase A and acyltransferase 4-like n=1 Tax=Trematomus bernacchii TaxID=40690 RepID=UPI00146E7DCC|nr:phospholipase A and acyltransferase 4-like [Trematomus bernacchii]
MAPTLFDQGPKPGDLIKISRGTYEHWAVYIGGNEVVHLIPPSGDDSNPFNSLMMLLDSNKAEVRCQKLWEVVGPHRYKINNFLDYKYEPRQRDIIVREACRMVGQELPYSLTSHNCEHFVTELRYGISQSRQVDRAAAIGGAAVVGVGVGILAAGAILLSGLFKDHEEEEEEEERRHRN